LFHGYPIDSDLDRKATIPTKWLISEITEINTNALDNSGTDTIKAVERIRKNKIEMSCTYATREAGIWLHELLFDS